MPEKQLTQAQRKNKKIFDYPWRTSWPKELSRSKWHDVSWSNDASASAERACPSAKHPKGGFVLWAQTDDKDERELPEMKVYSLTWLRDLEERDWDESAGDKTLIESDDFADILKKIDEVEALAPEER